MIAGLLLAAGCENPAGEEDSTPAASEYSITLTQPENGSFTVKVGDGTPGTANITAAPGAVVTLTATPESGYKLKQWIVSGITLANAAANPATFTMPLENLTVTAEFEAEEGGDTTPPVVSGIIPADSAVGVGITGSIGITFSEGIRIGSAAGAELADGAISGADLAAWLPGFKFGTISGGNEAESAISAASYNRAANTLTLNFTGLANSTLYYLTIDGICDTAGNALVQTVRSFTTAQAGAKTVSAGPQSGTLTYGTAGNAAYAVTTANIDDSATAVVNWISGTPAGVTDNTGTAVVTGNALSLTLTTTAGTPAGTWNFTVTIDGATSAQQSLTVNKAAVTALDITLDAPVKGTALAATAAAGSTPASALSASTVNVSWNPSDTNAAAGTEYTATLILTAGANYSLAGITTGDITASGASPDVKSISAESATLTLAFPATEPAAYAITAQTPTNGSFTVQVGSDTAVSGSTTAEAGTTITLTATADPDYQFKQWSVTGVTLDDDVTDNPATFTMPNTAVTVTAEFESSVVNPTLTFNVGNAENGPDPETVAAGTQVSAPVTTGTNEGFTFGGWFTDTTLRTPVEFPITVNEDIVVYAKWDNSNVLRVYPWDTGWTSATQLVQLPSGNYKLGVEYKVEKDGDIYGKVTISVYHYNGSSWAAPVFYFSTGDNLEWTREEKSFDAPVNNGWYAIRIEDGTRKPDSSTKTAYINRIWLYPENTTSAGDNKLGDADFASGNLVYANDRGSYNRFINNSGVGAPYNDGDGDLFVGYWGVFSGGHEIINVSDVP
jgi:uncharacterized repeat protein (TIGR02543 family)